MTTSVKSQDQAQLLGNVLIEHRDQAGQLLSSQQIKNLVVATGRGLLVQMLGGNPNYSPTHLALGTGSTTPADGDTALVAEEYRDLITRRGSAASSITYQLYVGQTDGNGFTYAEAGLLNVRSGVDTLFARVIFSPIAKTSSDTITITWTITLASS